MSQNNRIPYFFSLLTEISGFVQIKLQIRIQETQNHTDTTDPENQCFGPVFIFFRIRIQRLWLETSTDPDPDPIRIQGFNDQKLEKNYS
jgi:hypothetical protein